VVFQLLTVPLNKRFVIEYATASGQLPDGTKMSGFITTTVGGITAQHQLVMIEQGVMSGHWFSLQLSRCAFMPTQEQLLWALFPEIH
jgi:hypothetical protein